MPSFKTCFTTLALMAFAMAPAVSASQEGHSVAKRTASSPEIRALARANAAKRALSRRAPQPVAAPSTSVYTGTYPTAFAETPESIAAAKTACVTTSDCSGVTVLENSVAVCLAQACRLRCKTGFIPGGTPNTPPSNCVPDDTSCTSAKGVTIQCPYVDGGYTKCNHHGTKCYIKCPKANVLKELSDGSYKCYDIYHDTSNCGTMGTVCPPDYNNTPGSSPRCYRKECTLWCPAGTTVTPTGNADKPYTCA